MENDILEILQQHKLGHITEEQALNELCVLFSVVQRSELYTCECKVCGKPFDNNEDYYRHYDEEHN